MHNYSELNQRPAAPRQAVGYSAPSSKAKNRTVAFSLKISCPEPMVSFPVTISASATTPYRGCQENPFS
jgi:hypothetical protein